MSQTDKFKLNLFKGTCILMFAIWIIALFVSMLSDIIIGAIIGFVFAFIILFLLGFCAWVLGIKKIVEKQNKALHR